MSEPVETKETSDTPASEEVAEEVGISARARLARILGYLSGVIVAAGAGYWLFERLVYAQVNATGGNRLFAFLTQVASDLVQIGLPVVLAAATISFAGILGYQLFGSLIRRYLGIADLSPKSELFPSDHNDAISMRHEYWLRMAALDEDESENPVTLRRKIRNLQSQVSSLEEQCAEETARGVFEKMGKRLSYERTRLSGNSRTNLLIGIFASLLALGVLGLPLVNPELLAGAETIADTSFWRQYATRLPVGLLLQFVSFFFLRLYVACEMDIKSNKNEMTNIEAKYLAFMMSAKLGVGEAEVVSSLASTERNFVLKRGERTISVENDSRYNDLKETVDKLIDIVGSTLEKKPAG